jgi:muramoyltetrapeptide carboxypeptidase
MFCPSHVADKGRYDAIIAALNRLGFSVKLGDNFWKDTNGYAASAEERAADLNALVTDDSVGMILFSGGDSAAEVLPYIDYESIKKHPKIFSSYSDGTSILLPIHAQTGLVTYYGAGAGEFYDLRHYDYLQFVSHFIEGHEIKTFVKDSEWKTIKGGACEGTLIGGYAGLFALMFGNTYFKYNKEKKYLLFLEDYEIFGGTGRVATYLAGISQSGFMNNVTGLIFGHYAENPSEDFYRLLERFADKHGIPVVYTDDFGHGTRHAIFPIGTDAKLDADKRLLEFI